MHISFQRSETSVFIGKYRHDISRDSIDIFMGFYVENFISEILYDGKFSRDEKRE